MVSDNSLRPISVNRQLFFSSFLILDIRKCGHWIGVAINIIKTFWAEESFVVFMFEKLPSHHEPSIRVSVESLLVLDVRGMNFEVDVF